MKANWVGLFLVCAVLATALTAAMGEPMKEAERGAYLVKTSGCTDCHSPKMMSTQAMQSDMARYLAGHPEKPALPAAPMLPQGPWMAVASGDFTAWAGPWGTSFSANLTPDKETGLGAWTGQTFVDAVRQGRHMGRGRPILPPMPYQALQNATDEDLKGIFAYLATLPAVRNQVPNPILPETAEEK